MGWESPSRWLANARALQLVAALVSAALHGFTTIWVHVKKLGLTQHMVVLELLIVIVLVYTTVAILVQHCGWRSVTKPGLIAFVVFDLVFCAMVLGIISLLARSGLPVNCVGLTRTDYQPGDTQPPPHSYGFSTVRFSNESGGLPGQLDKFCGLERAYFGFANALVFFYIATIVLNIVRIFELKYIKLGNSGEDEEMNLKTIKDLEQPSPISSTARVNVPPPAPPSEGIISRTASLRSTTTASTFRPAYSAIPARANTSAIPRRPVGAGGPMPSPYRRPGPDGFSRVSLDEDSDNAEAALVSDGLRHQHRQPPSRDYPPHAQQYPHPHSHHQRMPSLLEEDQMTTTSDMDHALVSDGMRPSAPMLPPYEPGNRRTSIGG
ncbi:hypothetical protein B0T21DRAFT_361576 [Apiosordaria backusii]|uniref:MARVEL domain-containing protein n=1 Tax=Apiosordaria backusii TaxID=314023 RepID=A0AA40K1M8_9PEZI|nr:hypothetical protein B0T21DRAFT_361576 [Apiosordaria backusii]